MNLLIILLTIAVSYFLGCFNGALLVSKYILHNDVRNHGSGNAGLTNFYRVFGGKLTAVVILCDLLKAIIAVLIGGWLMGSFMTAEGWGFIGKYVAGVACMLGHMFPCMFQFRGGKGVLSGAGVVLMTDWRIFLIVIAAFALAVGVSKMVSLGSLAAGLTFPIATACFYPGQWLVIVLSAVIGILIFWRHRSNIGRILKGEESTFHLHRKEESKSEESK